MATKSIVGILTTRLQLESVGFSRGLTSAVKDVESFRKVVDTNLVKAMSSVTIRMRALLVKGFRGIATAATLALGSVVRFADFIAGRFLVALVRLTTALKSTVKAFTVVVGGLTIALALLTRSSFKSIDAIAKTATKLGIPIEKMKGLEIAAAAAGITFEAFTTGLQRAARRIEDALSGMGVGVKPLEDLGINIREIAALSPDKQILKIADALEQVGRQGQKILIGFGLFDTEGVANILLTADALREAERFAKEMGITISEIDAAKIEAANDATARLKFTFRGLFDVIAVKAAPAIEAFANLAIKKLIEVGGVTKLLSMIVEASIAFIKPKILALADAFAKVGLFIAQQLSAGLNNAALAMINLGDNAVFVSHKIRDSFSTLGTAIRLTFLSIKFIVLSVISGLAESLDRVVDDIIKSVNFLVGTLQGVAGIFFLNLKLNLISRDAENQLSAFGGKLEAQILDTAAEIVETWDEAMSDAMQLEIPTSNIDEFIRETGGNLARMAADSAVSFSLLTNEIEKALIETPASERLTALMERLRDLYAELIANNKQFNSTLKDTPPLLEEVAKEVKKVAREVVTFSDILLTAGNRAIDSFADALVRGEKAMIVFRNVVIQALQDIAAELLKGILRNFFVQIGAAIVGSVGGGGGGGGGLSPDPGAIGGAATDTGPALKSLPVPEGGGVAEININFFGDTMGDDAIEEQVFKGINKAQPGLTDIAVNTVHDKAARDPRFRRVFAA